MSEETKYHSESVDHYKPGHDAEHKDPVKHYLHLTKKAKRIVDTTNRVHRQAHEKGIETHLINEQGEVDYEKLHENPELQLKFADTMADFYLENAKKAVKVDPKYEGDVFYNDLLTNAFYGATRARLRKAATETGKNFTFELFNEKVRPAYMKDVEGTLYGAAASHLKEEHKKDIVKFVKAEDFVDTDKMTLEDAVELLARYDQLGTVSSKMVEGKTYAKKKPKEKEEMPEAA